MANSDIVYEDLTLTEDNVTLLKNSNREISDKVGWGEAQDFETTAAENPPAGKSLGRKWNQENQTYQDTDDNSQDFEIQDPTPGVKNQTPTPPEETPQDTTPPQVVFESVSPLQTTLSFTISWSGEDPVGEVTPSGIEGFQLRHSEDKENWNYWPSESEYTSATTTEYVFEGKDEHTYYFQIKAKDKAGNESEWTPMDPLLIEISLHPVIINEIAWMGTKAESNDEWIELSNNTTSSIDLAGWKIKKNGEDFITISISAEATTTIPAQGLYLLERKHNQEKPDDTISNILADQIYTGGLSNEGDELELFDDNDVLIDIVDCSNGWFAGRNYNLNGDFIRMSMERVNPKISGNDPSNWMTNDGFTIFGQDANGEPIQGTPKQQNSRYNFSSGTFLPWNPIPSTVQDTIFTPKGSPYIIKTGLIVSVNTTLIIEPGVIIKFIPNYGFPENIRVEGTLIAGDFPGEPVVFTSNLDSPTPGSWRFIHFIGPNSILNNVIVEYGGWFTVTPLVVRGAIFVEDTTITIKNSVIENNLVAGVWLKNSDSLIEETTFKNNNQDYYYLPRAPGSGKTVALYLEDSNPTLINLTFEGNAVNIYPEPTP